MKNGFTLIEIMVAVSIFAIVAVITTGALVTASEVNRKAQAIKIAMDNVAFAMDSMVVNLREGVNYHCLTVSSGVMNNDSPVSYLTGMDFGRGNLCAVNGVAVVFGDRRAGRGGSDKRIIYRLKEDNELGRIQFASSDATDYVNITSPEVDIDYFRLYVPTSNEWPRITVVIRGKVPGKTPTEFNLQTTLKQNF